jgi:hypothetical protein
MAGVRGDRRAFVGADDDVAVVEDVVDRPDRGERALGEDDPAQGDAAQESQGLGAVELHAVPWSGGGERGVVGGHGGFP